MCSQNKGSLQFEDKWDLMRPIVLKLLRQESVTKQQWFDLFSYVCPQPVARLELRLPLADRLCVSTVTFMLCVCGTIKDQLRSTRPSKKTSWTLSNKHKR